MSHSVSRLLRYWLALLSVLTATLLIEGCDQAPDTGDADEDEADRLRVSIGYMPILADAQLFVTLKTGGLARAGIDPELISFQNGPAVVQALASGQLDMAYMGIGPAMVARAKGADIRVVASNINRQISMVGLDKLVPLFERGDPSTAFARFRKKYGRKAKISTFPRGSVPQTVLDYWLRHQLQADPDDVEIIHQGTSQAQQALLTEAVDGAAILEPAVSIATHDNPGASVIASGSELFPDHPGAVLAVRQSLIEQHPEVVQRLVAEHEQATHALRDQDSEALAAVGAHVGGGRLSDEEVARSVAHSQDNFEADPQAIIPAVKHLHKVQIRQGSISDDLDIETLFDPSFHERLTRAGSHEP